MWIASIFYNVDFARLLDETWEYCTTNEEQICLRGWFFADTPFAFALNLFLTIVLVKLGAQLLRLMSDFTPW